MEITIIIVNWNGRNYLGNCLRLALNQSFKDYNIVLVDNNSKDGSLKHIPKDKRIHIIRNKKNVGFAEGNNIGIRYALKNFKPRYIALLNSDAFPDKYWLESMYDVARHSGAGMVTPRTLLMNGKVDTLGLRVNLGLMSFDIKDELRLKDLFCPSGVAALYSVCTLNNIRENNDYFDSKFFMYAEDLDLGFRARNKGWQCRHAEQAIVYHIHGASGVSDKAIYYVHRNTLWAMRKNFNKAFLLSISPYIIIYNLAAIGINILRGKGKIILQAKYDGLFK